MKIFVLILFLTVCHSCFLKEPKTNVDSASLPYDLSLANDNYVLDAGLKEISGLCYNDQENSLLAVNDELGLFFSLDPNSGKILKESSFGQAGDYEGITLKDSIIYIINSKGTIHAYSSLDNTSEIYTLPLKKRNNVEGLAFQPSTGNLLIACKGRSKLEGDNPILKTIFSYDLNTQMLIDSLMISIDISSPTLGRFAPSGIAIHPHLHHLYIVSGRSGQLMVTDFTGNILHVEQLDPAIHRQAEGICFDSVGNLYIANEGGKKRPPLIVKYFPKTD